MMAKARDYQRENKYKAQPAQIEKRVGRNRGRAILGAEVGKAALKGKEVDHINGDPTDNRRANLRVVTPRQNNNGSRGGPAKVRGAKKGAK
jgi:hypothetical protein